MCAFPPSYRGRFKLQRLWPVGSVGSYSKQICPALPFCGMHTRYWVSHTEYMWMMSFCSVSSTSVCPQSHSRSLAVVFQYDEAPFWGGPLRGPFFWTLIQVLLLNALAWKRWALQAWPSSWLTRYMLFCTITLPSGGFLAKVTIVTLTRLITVWSWFFLLSCSGQSRTLILWEVWVLCHRWTSDGWANLPIYLSLCLAYCL